MSDIERKDLTINEEMLLYSFNNMMIDHLLDSNNNDIMNCLKYLCLIMDNIENNDQFKYLLGYVAKEQGLIDKNEYVFDEEEQFKMEAIMHSAMNLYKHKNTNKKKIEAAHSNFVNSLDQHSNLDELHSIKNSALNELGYDEINENNAKEVFDNVAKKQKLLIKDKRKK